MKSASSWLLTRTRIYISYRGRTIECTDLAATCVIASLNICVRWHSECWLDTVPSAENLKANSGGGQGKLPAVEQEFGKEGTDTGRRTTSIRDRTRTDQRQQRSTTG